MLYLSILSRLRVLVSIDGHTSVGSARSKDDFVRVEGEAADRTYSLTHEGRIVPDNAQLFAFQAEDFDHLFGGSTCNNWRMPVDSQCR